MGYIPDHALAGLKNYKYKGVDKCVRPILGCSHHVFIFELVSIGLCYRTMS